MKDIYIKGVDIYLKEMTVDEAVIPYLWYSSEKGYTHATGLNTGLSWTEFIDMLNNSTIKENEFFLAIYKTKSNSISGFIKGMIFEGTSIIFINALAIEHSVRNTGIGTKALNATLKNFKEYGCNTVFVTVDIENKEGLNFWYKNGFIELRTIRKKDIKSNSFKFIKIMKKNIV